MGMRFTMDYIKNNKQAWEEAFEHRHEGFDIQPLFPRNHVGQFPEDLVLIVSLQVGIDEIDVNNIHDFHGSPPP